MLQVQQRIVKDRTVDAINLDPHSYTRPAITLFDVHNHYFPGMETNELKNSLLNGVKCDLYVANTYVVFIFIQVLSLSILLIILDV